MPAVSVILCCYNTGKYLSAAIVSVLEQDYKDLELIFVDDGSTDNSLAIAESFAVKDNRIKILRKTNGGLNTARIFGANNISADSEALLFFDADDILDKRMIGTLYNAFVSEDNVGAVYCNFQNIDDNGAVVQQSFENRRLVTTNYWFKKLPACEKYTPFFSIYCWTLMVEPFTMLHKDLYFKHGGWDEKHFPKGDTYGESIPLFSEIAIHHKIVFVNEVLYSYRKHSNQITSGKFNMEYVQRKIDGIMLQKNYNSPKTLLMVRRAIALNRYRVPLYNYVNGYMKYDIRYKPFLAAKQITIYFLKYLYSFFILSTMPGIK